MKKFIVLIFILLVFLTSCHNLENETKEFLESRQFEISESGQINQKIGEDLVTLKWAVPFLQGEFPFDQEFINMELSKLNKPYKVEILYMDPSKNKPLGKSYRDFVLDLIEKDEVDIFSRGVKKNYNTSFYNTDVVVRDEFLLESLKNEDIFSPVPEKYIEENMLKYDNRYLGIGNRKYSYPYGIMYTKDFVENLDYENLDSDINKYLDKLIDKRNTSNNPNVLLHFRYYDVSNTLKTPLEIFSFSEDGQHILPFFATNDYEKFTEIFNPLYQNDLITAKDNSNIQVIFTTLDKTSIIEKINEDTYEVEYLNKTGYFKTLGYKYQSYNYINNENMVAKNSQNIEYAFDFLNMLYYDKDVINSLYQSSIYQPNFIHFANENYLDENQLILEKYGEKERYLSYYKNNNLDGLYFDESHDDFNNLLEDVKVIYDNNTYSDQINNLFKFNDNQYEVKDKIRELSNKYDMDIFIGDS